MTRRRAPGLLATIMAGGCVGFVALGVLFTLAVVSMIWMGRDNLAGAEWAAAAMLAISMGSTGLFAWWARTLWRGERLPASPWRRPSVGMPCAWRGARGWDLTLLHWHKPLDRGPYRPYADMVLGRRGPAFVTCGQGVPENLHLYAMSR